VGNGTEDRKIAKKPLPGQGHQQKIFQGGEPNGKQKISKKIPKNSTI